MRGERGRETIGLAGLRCFNIATSRARAAVVGSFVFRLHLFCPPSSIVNRGHGMLADCGPFAPCQEARARPLN